ncbi:MAG: hypothetical protein GX601_08460 [Anaerolineales bacterium]|nr:hypothetical protein [Anaerolineales bacterium]
MKRIPRWLHETSILAAYCALTVIMTLPAALHLGTYFIGQDIDVWINPWVTWWTRRVLNEGGSLYYTNLMFHPHGVDLAFHSFSHLNTAIALLLEQWMNAVAAQNVTVLLAHAISGTAMFHFVRRLTGHNTAAFLAGVVYAFYPYRMAESVHPVIVSTQWMPLFLLFFLEAIDEGRRRAPVLAALFFLLTALTSWHLMLFSIILAALYLLCAVGLQRKRLERVARENLLLFGGLAAVTVVPIMIPMIRAYLTASEAFVGVDVAEGVGTSWVEFVLPQAQHPLFGLVTSPVLASVGSVRAAYLGATAVCLSAAGWILDWRRTRVWLLIALVCILFTLGPTIQVPGAGSKEIVLPWSIPIVWLFRRPLRFNLLVGFAVAVGSGLGLASLERRWAGRGAAWRTRFAALTTALVLFDYMGIPFPMTSAEVPDFYATLDQTPHEGALLELPLGRQPSKLYIFYQMTHGRPLIEGVVSRTPQAAYTLIEQAPVLRSLRACGQAYLPPADISPYLDELAAYGIQTVIFHKHLATAPSAALWQWARGHTPDYEDTDVAAYDTQRGASRAEGLQLLDRCIGVRALASPPVTIAPGEVLTLPIELAVGTAKPTSAVIDLLLTHGDAQVAPSQRCALPDDVPSSTPMRHQVDCPFTISESLPDGTYQLNAQLVSGRHLSDIHLSAQLLELRVSDHNGSR